MTKFVVLCKFTEKGITNIQQSPDRADALRASAEKMGIKVPAMLWTAGPYDALIVMEAPDETTAAAFVLGVAKLGNITTTMMPAYDAAGFRAILGKMK